MTDLVEIVAEWLTLFAERCYEQKADLPEEESESLLRRLGEAGVVQKDENQENLIVWPYKRGDHTRVDKDVMRTKPLLDGEK